MAALRRCSTTASTAPLRIALPSRSMPLIRVWAVNGTKRCAAQMPLPRGRSAPWPARRSSGPRASRRRARRAGLHRPARARRRRAWHELGRLPVAQRDRAGLVEQQRVDVARGLDGAARHGEHVEAHQPVHAGDADGGEQGADRGRDQGHEQRHQRDDRHLAAGVGGEARDARPGEDEDQLMPASRMLRAISFGVFCRTAPSTSAIIRSRKVEPWAAVIRTLIQSDKHAGAAGDGRAVAAALADHRRRFAGDRRLVDRGDALDHLAVGRDQVAGLDQDEVADLRVGRRHALDDGRHPRGPAAWPWSGCGRAAGSRPAPCRGPRPRPRRSSRTGP